VNQLSQPLFQSQPESDEGPFRMKMPFAILFLLLYFVSAQEQHPNIIFFLADDLGYGHLGSYGQKEIMTPRLDTMAGEGIRFTNAYAGSSVCAPSRSTLMTGQHTGHTRIRDNDFIPLLPEDFTVAEVLKRAGYTTGLIGKWGLGEFASSGVPNAQGFDYFYGYLNQNHAHNYYPEYLYHNNQKITLTGNLNGEKGEYSHDLFTQKAKDFIHSWRMEPFFLLIAYTIPHAFNEGNTNPVPSQDPYTEKPWPEEQKNVAAMITRMDTDVGEILDLLKTYGIDNKTIVFFSSDNGPHSEGGHDHNYHDANGPLRGKKRDLYEGGIRIPMIVRWSGTIEPGGTSSLLTASWDFLPTAANIASEPVSEGIDGISILPELLGYPQPTHDYLYWEMHKGGFKQAVRKGNWKGVHNNVSSSTELYDLSVDIGESNNVAGANLTIVAEIEDIFVNGRTPSPYWPTPEASVVPTCIISPPNGSIDVSAGSTITVTFSEAVRKTDDIVLDNNNVDAVITLKNGDANGTDIPFDATVNDSKTVIIVDPSDNFLSEQTVYVGIGARVLEDYVGNALEPISVTFTTEDITSFDLVYPYDDTIIILTRSNSLDTLYFAWNQSVNTSGDEVTYRRELTGDLPEYIRFIVTSDEETNSNMYKVPYHHIEHYMHEAGVELISGTWTIVATNGAVDVYAQNGPFTLTIDGSKLNIDDGELVPETFALHANYPNPFNPSTTISYDLPEQAQVMLKVYDMLGKQIKTLVNQSQDAGSKTTVWYGTDDLGRQVSAGVYLYQIQAGDFTQTRKMLLLK
jgi:arylsulfatase A-like enzyme